MNILVTGGAGFLGSHLVQQLLHMGHAVCTLDNLSSGDDQVVQQLNQCQRHQFVKGSTLDKSLVERLVDKSDIVFHLAALLGVKNTIDNPLQVITENLESTQNVLEAAMRSGGKVIFASTSEIYGKNTELPFREDASDRVLGPPSIHRWSYATVKAMDEHLCYAYADKGLPVTIVRYFNAYGPRQSTCYGGVVAKFVAAAIRDETIVVHGDGQQTRCFTYVDDSVRGTILAMTQQTNGMAINIGSDQPVTIEHLAHLVRRLAKSASGIENVPYDHVFCSGFEDIGARVPDLSRALRVLGYRPTVSLEEGLVRTIEWYRNRGGVKTA